MPLPLAASVEAAATTPAAAPAWMMLAMTAVMAATYVGVAAERFHKTVAALAGALAAVVLGIAGGLIEYPAVYEFVAEELNLFGVIIGTGILVDVVGKSGLFHWIGMHVVRLTGGGATALFVAFCLMTFVFTSLLTIVPAMLIMSSLVVVICRALNYPMTPMMLAVAICANSGALATFASGLPNIMIGTAAEIPYVHFLMVSLPYAVISLVIAMVMMRGLFYTQLPWKQGQSERVLIRQHIETFNPSAMVSDRGVLIRGAVILLLTVLGFVFSGPLGVGMDFIALAGATAALLVGGRDVEAAINKVNWTVIMFFAALFVIIGCVKRTGALDAAAGGVLEAAGDDSAVLLSLLGGFSAVASSIVDNIPVAATLIPMVQNLTGQGVAAEPLWWTLILCCNLGGNGTPIGSISCVIALYALKREADVHISWTRFLSVGGLIMLVQVVGAIVYVQWMDARGLIPDL